MKPWKTGRKLLLIMAVCLFCQPVLAAQTKPVFRYDSFLCRYFNVIVTPLGGCIATQFTRVASDVTAVQPSSSPQTTERIDTSVTSRIFPVAVVETAVAKTLRTTVVQSVPPQPTLIYETVARVLDPYSQLAVLQQKFIITSNQQLNSRMDSVLTLLRGQSERDNDRVSDVAAVLGQQLADLQIGERDVSVMTISGTTTLGGVVRDSEGAVGMAGSVLQSTGRGVIWVATSSLGIDGIGSTDTITARYGGTGLSGVTQNQLLIGGAGDTWTQIATSSLGLSARFTNSTTLASLLTDETGTGAVVLAGSPTFTSQLTSPKIVGGITASSVLTLQSTTGAGSSDSIRFQVGNNGVTEAARIFSSGNVAFGATVDGGAKMLIHSGNASSSLVILNNASNPRIIFGNAAATNFSSLGQYSNGLSLSGSGDPTLNSHLYINDAGNIGIGTTSPSSLFSVGAMSSFQFLVTGDGVVSDGTWNADTITARYGGTGLSGVTQNQLLIGGAGDTWTQIATSSLGLSARFTNSTTLASLLTDETGTGAVVLAGSPTFTGIVVASTTELSGNVNLVGTAANIALGANWLSGDGDDEGIFASTTGNIGIGTSNIFSQLTVGSGAPVDLYLTLNGNGANERGIHFRRNNVLEAAVLVDIAEDLNISNLRANEMILFNTNSGTGVQTRMTIASNGNVGIGTTSPLAQLTTTGTVQFSNFGAGMVQSDSQGNLTVSSDERLKNIQGDYTAGLTKILGLRPILYRWNAISGMEPHSTYAGFSAQNVKDFLPEAVGQDSRGFLTLSDRPILAAVVNSIQTIWEKLQSIIIQTDINTAEIEVLKNENNALKERLDELESYNHDVSMQQSPSTQPIITSTSTVTYSSDTLPEIETPNVVQSGPSDDGVPVSTVEIVVGDDM